MDGISSLLKALPRQTQTLAQPLGQDVVPLSTATDKEKLVVLGAILQGLIEEVMSQDLIYLAVLRAKNICLKVGMNEGDFWDTAIEFMQCSEKARKRNPLHGMF